MLQVLVGFGIGVITTAIIIVCYCVVAYDEKSKRDKDERKDDMQP